MSGSPFVLNAKKRMVLSVRLTSLMSAGLPAQEGHDFALLQLPPSLGGAQTRPAVEHDDKLLLGEVVVVGIGRFAGGQLPQAQSQPLAACLTAEASSQAAKAWMLTRLIENGIVDVRHARSLCDGNTPISSGFAHGKALMLRKMKGSLGDEPVRVIGLP